MTTQRTTGTVLSIMLGVFFLVTGTAKTPTFESLVVSCRLVLAPLNMQSFAYPSAAGVIAAEIGVGLLLVTRRSRLIGLVLAAALILAFVIAVSILLNTGTIVECSCYGILPVHIPLHVELLWDIFLLNGTICLALFGFRWDSSMPERRRRNLTATVLISLALLDGAFYSCFLHRTILPVIPVRVDEVIQLASINKPGWRSTSTGPACVLLLNLHDFSCPVCFDDFLALTDSLSQEKKTRPPSNMLAVFGSEGVESLIDQNRFGDWLEETGLGCPFIVVPDSVLFATGFRRSMILIADPSGNPLLTSEFPTGERRRRTALALLTEH
jgi:hypothetical protein